MPCQSAHGKQCLPHSLTYMRRHTKRPSAKIRADKPTGIQLMVSVSNNSRKLMSQRGCQVSQRFRMGQT